MTTPLCVPSGWVIIDKGCGVSSASVTHRVKRLFSVKAGHAGTLDPMATGILPIALGKATPLIRFLLDHPKIYVFTVHWGVSTTTDDAMGEPCAQSSFRPSSEDIKKILPLFTGWIEQTPPIYSALKISGVPAYRRARRGEIFSVPHRHIRIHSLTLLETSTEYACFSVMCGSGTYVRSLGRDMAKTLGTEGHITVLRRTHVGPFTENMAYPLDFFEKIEHKERMAYIMPSGEALGLVERVFVSEEQRKKLHHGETLPWKAEKEEKHMVACYENDVLVALGHVHKGGLQPMRCFTYTVNI